MSRVSIYRSPDKLKGRIHERIKILEEYLPSFTNVEAFREELNAAVGSQEGDDFQFYLKILERTKHLSPEDVELLLNDWCFLLLLHSTLDVWGLNTGYRRLAFFEEFQHNLQNSRSSRGFRSYDLLKQLLDYNIEEFSQVKIAVQDLYEMINPYRPNTAKIKIVGRSKLLHFLLPNLVMPIDRKYTLRYFGLSDISEITKYSRITETEVFLTIQEAVGGFARKHREELRRLIDNRWNQTIPKVVDNLIIHYVKTQL